MPKDRGEFRAGQCPGEMLDATREVERYWPFAASSEAMLATGAGQPGVGDVKAEFFPVRISHGIKHREGIELRRTYR